MIYVQNPCSRYRSEEVNIMRKHTTEGLITRPMRMLSAERCAQPHVPEP